MCRLSPLFACLLLISGALGGNAKEHVETKDKLPWFCHDKDCPRYATLKEWGDLAIRRYESSVWASVCILDVQHEEAVWRGTAELMSYIKGDNDKEKEMWGGIPFAHHLSLSEEHMAAWGATAQNESSVECTHKTVCVAYYLPEKYQGEKRPPKPNSNAVRIVRVPRWMAYVSEFDGFPTKFRVIGHFMRMVRLLKAYHLPFNWRVAVSFVYDPPFATEHRHNEVLVPARRLDQLFGQDAEDLYADQKRVLPVRTTAMQAIDVEEELARELAADTARTANPKADPRGTAQA